MKVHFVCEGNTYRSRLADAYFNSLNIEGAKASSSGIKAAANISGPITWVAALLLRHHALIRFLSSNSWIQTDAPILAEADIVIFMEDRFYEFSKKELGYEPKQYQIWGVEDIEESTTLDADSLMGTISLAEKTFDTIRAKVDLLVQEKLS